MIPDKFKSRRQVIIETFLACGSIPETAQMLNKAAAYVRRVIRAYQEEVRRLERTARGAK